MAFYDNMILSHELVTIDGAWIVNRFIDHLQVVATNNCYIVADFQTTNFSTLTSSQSTYTSLDMVTAVHNGYSSAMFLLDISW
jgi:hypothetical protein